MKNHRSGNEESRRDERIVEKELLIKIKALKGRNIDFI
jgi:hypothetical protein